MIIIKMINQIKQSEFRNDVLIIIYNYLIQFDTSIDLVSRQSSIDIASELMEIFKWKL